MAEFRDNSKKGGFVYKPRTAEQVKVRATQQGGLYDSCYKSQFPVWTPKEGDNNIRIMPPTWQAAQHYGIDVFIHSGVGADQQSYLCKSKMNEGDPCCICDERDEAAREGDDKYAGDLKPYRRVLVWIIDRDDEKAGPQLWPMPWTIDRDITQLSIDKASKELLNIDDPDNGYDVSFSKSGTGIKTKYSGVAVARRSTPLADSEKVQSRWLQFIMDNPLYETLNYYDEEHILKVFQGKKTKADDDAGETQPRTRAASRQQTQDEVDDAPRPAKRPVQQDDEPAPAPRQPARQQINDPNADLDDDAPPAPRQPAKRQVAEADDDAPPAKAPVSGRAQARQMLAEDDDDTPPVRQPARQTRPAVEDDDAPPARPVARRQVAEDDEPAPAPRQPAKRQVVEDDEDDQ